MSNYNEQEINNIQRTLKGSQGFPLQRYFGSYKKLFINYFNRFNNNTTALEQSILSPNSLVKGSLTFDTNENLAWPTTTTGYTLYTGGVSSVDDGDTIPPIALPFNFTLNGVSSNQLYVNTNGYFTIGAANITNSILSGPTVATPAVMCANPRDSWLQFGLENTDNTFQNIYYEISNTEELSYIKLLVYGGQYGNITNPTSWIANLYRDTASQWFEVRAKSNAFGNAGPYNITNVSRPSSTISQVWKGDLNGQNWVYMGTGSVTAN
jgi:hypothetical protein